jgi:hypothetical protein
MDSITTEFDSEANTWTITYDRAPVTVTVVLDTAEALEMAKTILGRETDAPVT